MTDSFLHQLGGRNGGSDGGVGASDDRPVGASFREEIK